MDFDEKTGATAYDTSGSGFDGTLNNGATWTDLGKSGAALELDGDNDYVSIGDIDPGTSFTLETWYKADSLPTGWHNLIMKAYTYGFEFNGTQLQAKVGSGSSWVTWNYYTSDVNNWHHLALTYDGSDSVLYVDGVYNDLDTGTAAVDSNYSLVIGSWTGTSEYFDGAVDEMRLYDYVRTPSQIAWSFNKGAPVGWWKLDESSGTTSP